MTIPPTWILCQPRTGSWFLATILNDTGLFPPYSTGVAFSEWFNPAINSPEQLAAVRANPPSFAKVHSDHLQPEEFEAIASRLPDIRFIHLTRQDRVAQAVSLAFTTKTGIWTADTATGLADYLAHPVECGDAELLASFRQVEAWSRAWDGCSGDRPEFRLTYEDLRHDPIGTTAAILGFLGIDPDPHIIATAVAKANERQRPMTRPETAAHVERLRRLLELNS